MEGINNRCLAKIKRTGRRTIIPISLVYKKSANGKFQQATSEHAKRNVDMYMKVPGKDFVPISILRFRARKSQLLKIINLSPSAKRIHIAKKLSITPRPARKSAKPVNKGMQRNTREARVTKKKSLYNKENVLRCSDDNVMTCGLRVENVKEPIDHNNIKEVLKDVNDITLSSTSSQQLQQIPNEIEY
ncbi:hypothetical protein PV326_002288, partial [Microctonus aethiopoides]